MDLKQDGVGKRMKDFNKINDQNQFLLKRLQSAKSEYSKDNWLKGMSKQMALKRNLKTGRSYSLIRQSRGDSTTTTKRWNGSKATDSTG